MFGNYVSGLWAGQQAALQNNYMTTVRKPEEPGWTESAVELPGTSEGVLGWYPDGSVRIVYRGWIAVGGQVDSCAISQPLYWRPVPK